MNKVEESGEKNVDNLGDGARPGGHVGRMVGSDQIRGFWIEKAGKLRIYILEMELSSLGSPSFSGFR